MKTFQYKYEKYTVPTSWEEVTLKQIIKITSDQDSFKFESTQKLAFISAFCGIPVETLKKSSVTEVGTLFKYLGFLNKPLPEEPIYEFEFQGHKYSVAETMAKQEFQDFVSMETVLADSDGTTYKALPMMMAIMCKREGESLDDYDVQERAKMFEEVPITIAHPLSVFFCNQEKIYNALSQLSLKQDLVIAMKARDMLDTLKPLDGMGLLTRLLIGILRSYIRFTMLPRKPFSISMRVKSCMVKCKAMCMRLFQRDKKRMENNY